jgi:hypothetical protein
VHFLQECFKLDPAKVRPLALRPVALTDLGLDILNQFGVGLELLLQFVEVMLRREVLSSGSEIRNT